MRHRKELRDLRSQITQKKKNATKKTRKAVNEECLELEQNVKEHQQDELDELLGQNFKTDEDGIELNEAADCAGSEQGRQDAIAASVQQKLDGLNLAEPTDSAGVSRRPNRQKARLARRTAEQEAAAVEAEKEVADLPDLRAKERAKMIKEIELRAFVEKDIRSDGHCLYAAVADQLQMEATKSEPQAALGYQTIRHAAASFISAHHNDFVPFLEEPLEDYVHKVRDTAEWGGQLELSALARAYKIAINVLQAEGRVEKIVDPENEDGGQEIWLAYYRHSFGLGEHYNSLRKKP